MSGGHIGILIEKSEELDWTRSIKVQPVLLFLAGARFPKYFPFNQKLLTSFVICQLLKRKGVIKIMKRLILPSLAIFLLVVCGNVSAQQEQVPDKIAGSEQFPTNSYSYMGGKGHYLPESPHYMAGKKHYLPDSVYYMVGKEQYLPKPSEMTAEESGQGPVSNEEANSGKNEEIEGQERSQNQVNIIITPEEPIYYYESGISLFPVPRPRHKKAIDRPPSVASHLGNFNLNVNANHFHH